MATKNRENEAGLIGAVLKDPSKLESLIDIMSPGDFDWQCYGWAWEAIVSLHRQGLSIDAITVGDELERHNHLGDFQTAPIDNGGPFDIFHGRHALSVLRDQGEPRTIYTYAENVMDYSAKRQLMGIWTIGADWTQNGRKSTQIMLDIAKKMSDIRTFDGSAFKHTETLAEAVSAAYDRTDRASRGEVKFVETGYGVLDEMLGGGMSAPDLIVVAARPGQGKTALLASIAKNAAEKGKRIAFFSLEMQNEQIAMRLLAQESGVSYDKQKNGKLTPEEWERYTRAIEALADKERYPIMLNDLPEISVSKMRQELRRMGKVDLIVVDYIQLGGADGRYDRRDLEIGEMTRGLKSIGKEFGIPVLAAAQLSRESERRNDKKPILSDLRESGSIENDSDIVMFIYRPDPLTNNAEIIVAKHRNGKVGSVDLLYKPSLTRFESAQSRMVNLNEAPGVEK